MQLSANLRDIEASATLAITALARELRAQGRDIIDLSAGEPDFQTPEFIREAGIAAIQQGATRYTAAAGLPALRQAIAEELARRTGKHTSAAGVVVTAGAKQALFNACFALFGPGDRVLLPTPYWTSYPALIRLARAEPVLVAGEPARSFKITPDELDVAYTPDTRGLILNSPSNPTGAVYTLAELAALLQWAAEHELWVISDEIYGRLCFNAPRAPSLLDLEDALLTCAVLVDGASKSYAMTGWRIGFSYSAPELAAAMAALQSHITSNATTPAQHAAIAAFSAEPLEARAVDAMAEAFRERRDHVVALFRSLFPGIDFVYPDGAFYLFFRVDAFYRAGSSDADSVALCRRVLEETGVALVPGAAFGDDRYVRLSFAAPEDALTEALQRVAGLLAPQAQQQRERAWAVEL